MNCIGEHPSRKRGRETALSLFDGGGGIGSANEKAKKELQKKTKQNFNALRSSIFQFLYTNDKFYLEWVKYALNRFSGSERGIYV